ncbi:acyl-CoA dehydrogenase family protein [Denitrificimonas caeni]|jgi:alkylation response protein AidB-like acyl-CoA dehydrogenase|uniref:acyl-CoA dehydrogenase family protein n=1 Tax=Denitrificimonas caeni TaxID=521720 RepID=UPI001964F502|nr:acyl-CoA dehydrogenase family protein [Denitrificimonas caeni]MDY0415023.1 acyl-CoA dehydrogenase family protein [Pseudomonas sp.]
MNSTSQSVDLEQVRAYISEQLAPLVKDIDCKGLYPREFLHGLGRLNGFAAVAPLEYGGLGASLADQIEVTAAVSETCGSTGFVVWCQAACVWYLTHCPNEAARARYLPAVARGELLAGTGMSNTVKHLSNIEAIRLKARREGDGYRIEGVLPWVSNLAENQLIIVAAALDEGGYLMFAAELDPAQIELRACPTFAGLEGTHTFNVRFRNTRVDADQVLAHPEQFAAHMSRIRPGFCLSQIGIGAGIVRTSVESIKRINRSLEHVNCFLDDQHDELEQTLAELLEQTHTQSRLADEDATDILQVLRLRARIAELSLDATRSEALHTGARGYLMNHGAQRRQREALFVAIVTPALKHLRKDIQALEAAS